MRDRIREMLIVLTSLSGPPIDPTSSVPSFAKHATSPIYGKRTSKPTLAVIYRTRSAHSFALRAIVQNDSGLLSTFGRMSIGIMERNHLSVQRTIVTKVLQNIISSSHISAANMRHPVRSPTAVTTRDVSNPSQQINIYEPTQRFIMTWTALQHHNRTVHPPTCPYPSCEGKTFTAQKGLRAHFKLHEQQMIEAELTGALSDDDERPPKKKRRGGEVGRDWVCGRDGCSKDFKSKKAMTTHVNITHLGRRDFECSHEGCDQKFGYKHLLQRHLAKHTAPTSSSDDSDDTSPKAPDLTIDIVTGQAYAHSAEKKLESFQAIQCPFPKLDGLGLVRVSRSKLTCAYVFNRAYDFRRHLQSAHDITVEKDVATSWVQRHRVSLLA
ncbi:unnamed protein product [Mycena citricolor]|uniref:C2H2-type domain-containing protein n=1 Tax=Mycena citricolor TaxID=2018698 RepID=A0AAD2HYE9_9AGAR|nr:unnamed protein product [Mycena citricolor]